MSYLEGLTNQEHSNYIDNLTINERELDDNAKNRMILLWNLLLRNNNNDVNEATQSLFACLAEAVDLENEISIDVLNNCIASEEAISPISMHDSMSSYPSPISMHDSMSSYPSLESMHDSMLSYPSPEMQFVPVYESPSPISMHSSMPSFSSFSTLSLSPSSQESPIRRRTIHLRPVNKKTKRGKSIRGKSIRGKSIRRRTNRARTMHRRRRTNRKK